MGEKTELLVTKYSQTLPTKGQVALSLVKAHARRGVGGKLEQVREFTRRGQLGKSLAANAVHPGDFVRPMSQRGFSHNAQLQAHPIQVEHVEPVVKPGYRPHTILHGKDLVTGEKTKHVMIGDATKPTVVDIGDKVEHLGDKANAERMASEIKKGHDSHAVVGRDKYEQDAREATEKTKNFHDDSDSIEHTAMRMHHKLSNNPHASENEKNYHHAQAASLNEELHHRQISYSERQAAHYKSLGDDYMADSAQKRADRRKKDGPDPLPA